MNLYKLFILLYLFDQFFGVYTIYGNKKVLQLYMKKSKISSNLYNPKNINQQNLVKYLDDASSKIVISLGPAGTGKTLFSCQKAITQLKSEEISKIILTRPVVTVEEEIGFLPGNIIKKMDPWTKPIFDIFLEYYSKTELDLMLNSGKIEICPLAFMRGRTFKNSIILADEMQNSSPVQMKMLSTRIGVNTRLIITGDLNQSDIPKENGLKDFVSKVERYNNTEMIKIVRFDNNDVERSEIVKKVIEIYNYVKPINKVIEVKNDNITATVNATKIDNIKKTTEIKYLNKYENDAALIPIQHINKHYSSHNYDIFFESREF
jgi:phosphate starvation-inducible PhoH-like protein